ncbi:hypothetical protein ACWGFX_27490 [Streptomyces xanthophaeus]
MILILGLIILIAARVFAVAGVMTNLGSAHELTNDFSVFGYHVTSSTGALFLYGVAVSAAAVLGLALILAAARRASRHSRLARHDAPSPRSGRARSRTANAKTSSSSATPPARKPPKPPATSIPHPRPPRPQVTGVPNGSAGVAIRASHQEHPVVGAT